MIEHTVLNSSGEISGTIKLPEGIFDRPVNKVSLSSTVAAILKNARHASSHAKDRSEKRGGGVKPWRQKGTGRARHGSIRSPIWRGGGVTHGPTKERNYQAKVNKKVKDSVLAMALSAKLKDEEIIFVDEIKLTEVKTKLMAELLKKLVKKPASTLLVLKEGVEDAKKASRNLQKVDVLEVKKINIPDVLKHKYIIFEKAAMEEVVKKLS